MFEGIVSVFLGFEMAWFQFTFSKTISLNSNFQDLFKDILYFSVAQIFVDFLICIYRGKMKKVTLKLFLFGFNPLIFSKLFFSKTMIEMKLKYTGFTIYANIYRLVSNRRMSTFTMLIWYVLSLNM